jgi:hypothetical protein
MPSDDEIRHSKALEAEIVRDPDEQAKLEAANGVRQFDAVTEMIEYFSHPREKIQAASVASAHAAANCA